MNLSDLFQTHPEVRLASPSDNQGILDFFNSLPMEGQGLQLRYDRSPDFFAFLKLHSPDFLVFLLMKNSQIEGVGTLVIRPGFIEGREVKVGYLGDLRIKAGMKNALIWRKFYSALIQKSDQIVELKGVKHFLTAVMKNNTMAKSALVNPKKNGFLYQELSPYVMMNVYGKKFWKMTPKRYDVRFAKEDDLSSIQEFWKTQEQQKPFGQIETFEYALKNWDNFGLNDIVLALEDGLIRGMTGLWSPSMTKKIIIKKFPPSLKFLTKILRLRKSSFPREGEELRPLYLCVLNYQNPEILAEMIAFILKTEFMKDFHMLSFPFFSQKKDTVELEAFLSEEIPMSLYQVSDELRPDLFQNKSPGPPGFEMALV